MLVLTRKISESFVVGDFPVGSTVNIPGVGNVTVGGPFATPQVLVNATRDRIAPPAFADAYAAKAIASE